MDIATNGYRHVAEDELHAYVDGLLPPEDRCRIESYLSAFPGERERVESYRRQNVHLHRLFDWYMQPPNEETDETYDALADRYARTERRWVKLNSAFRSAAFAGAVAIACSVGWFASDLSGRGNVGSESFAKQAVEAHLLSGMETGTTDRPAVPAYWGSERLVWIDSRYRAVSSRAPDFTGFGFRLVDGRVLPTGYGPAVQFVYASGTGHRVSLFLGRSRNDSSAEPRESSIEDIGLATILLRTGETAFGLVGDVEPATIRDMANLVEGSIEAGTESSVDASAGSLGNARSERDASLQGGNGGAGDVPEITLNP